LSNFRNQEIRIVIVRALAENSSFIFLALEDVMAKKNKCAVFALDFSARTLMIARFFFALQVTDGCKISSVRMQLLF
jgi:hypothetical protein